MNKYGYLGCSGIMYPTLYMRSLLRGRGL